jgi:hypothetical protein
MNNQASISLLCALIALSSLASCFHFPKTTNNKVFEGDIAGIDRVNYFFFFSLNIFFKN